MILILILIVSEKKMTIHKSKIDVMLDVSSEDVLLEAPNDNNKDNVSRYAFDRLLLPATTTTTAAAPPCGMMSSTSTYDNIHDINHVVI